MHHSPISQLVDTGSRPFVCESCDRHFTRPDSLARHAKRHQHEASKGIAPYSSLSNTPQPAPETRNSFTKPQDIEYTFSTETPSSAANAEFQQDNGLSDESFPSLNWPDSTELLNSILSAEFMALPSLEMLPSQSIVRGGSVMDEEPVSPWLTSETDQGRTHGGNHAIQNLSQIINTLVRRKHSCMVTTGSL